MNNISLFTITKLCLLFFQSEHLNQFRNGKGFVWVVSDYFSDPCSAKESHYLRELQLKIPQSLT
jgi:hypothetical protein